MPQHDARSYDITPSWKQFFWEYLASVLTIPLFGIGLIAFYFVWRKHHQYLYRITNTQIRRVDATYSQHVDLVDIKKVSIRQSSLQEKWGIGTLVLQTSASGVQLEGIEEPEGLKELLEQAIASERQRRKQQEKTKSREPKYQPGNMDRIEYLTGLWQQGLLSDEDYKKEMKHLK